MLDLTKFGDLDRRVLEHYFQFKDKKAAYKSVYHKRKDFADFFKRQAIKNIIAEYNRSVGKKALKIMEEQGITLAYIQNRLKLLVEFNIIKFLKVIDGVPYFDFTKATEDDWYCLTEMSSSEVLQFAVTGEKLIPLNAVKFKTNCKVKSLELLGKTIAAYTDKTENHDEVQIVFADDYEWKEE